MFVNSILIYIWYWEGTKAQLMSVSMQEIQFADQPVYTYVARRDDIKLAYHMYHNVFYVGYTPDCSSSERLTRMFSTNLSLVMFYITER